MKNTLIKKGGITTAILGFGLVLSACGGGGGGGGSPSSVVPSTYRGAYTGALQPGDFVSFYVSGNTLSYTVTGVVTGDYCGKNAKSINYPYATCVGSNSLTGTLSLTPLSNVSGSNYFEAKAGTSTVYVFLSGNTGIFTVPSLNAAAVGYNTSNTSISSYLTSFTQTSHTFTYAYYKPGSSSINIYSLTVNKSYSFSYFDVNTDSSGSGCWMIDPHHPNRIFAIDTSTIERLGINLTSCSKFSSTWNPTILPQDYNVIVNPSGGITVDYTDYNGLGRGVGVGIQTQSYTTLTATSYTIVALDSNIYPIGPDSYTVHHATESITVSITSVPTSPNTTLGIGSYTTLYKGYSITSPYTGSLTYGIDCSGKQVPGIISASISEPNNVRECYDIFFDPFNNYYLSVGLNPPGLNSNISYTYTMGVGAIQQ